MWTRIFLKTGEKKSSVFKNIRIRVDGNLVAAMFELPLTDTVTRIIFNSVSLVSPQVDKVQQLIKEAERVGAKEAAAAASESAARVSYDLQTAAAEVQRAKAETVVLGEHQKQLEESKEIFKKELETILPGVINETGKETTEEGLRWVAHGSVVYVCVCVCVCVITGNSHVHHLQNINISISTGTSIRA